jgi:hypothetical protein
MIFVENSKLSLMEAQIQFNGYEIKVRLTLHENENFEEVGKNTVCYVSDIWKDIQSAIISSLYKRYIEDWSENRTKYDEEEFLKQILPQTIDFDDYEDEYCKPSYTMYFNDSNLFGNHGIEVYWKKDGKVNKESVTLVG